MPEKPIVFISHIADEAVLADILKKRLLRDFIGLIEIFASSDGTSIDAGSNWLTEIEKALKSAKIEIILCSRASIKRPWINFEAGAGWIRGIRIVPICHTGLRPAELPMPMTVLQAIEANLESDLAKLYRIIAKTIGAEISEINLVDLVTDIKSFEASYIRRMKTIILSDDQRSQNALSRMKEAMKAEKFKSRSIKRLAIIAGVSEGEAFDILRNDPDVIFDTSKDFGRMARLRSRMIEEEEE